MEARYSDLGSRKQRRHRLAARSLLAEAGYGDEAESQLRWRKTYVPGPGGLDDAVQVVVENTAFPGQGKKLYTFLRDELGTVLGVVAEDESQDPAKPTIPVRYQYTPYGEAYAEVGPELRRARFDATATTVGGVEQLPATPQTMSGCLRLTFSIPIDPASIAGGLLFEELTQTGWQAVDSGEAQLVLDCDEGLDLLVSLRSAWKRENSYRVRVGQTLKDGAGRPLTAERLLDFTIPASGAVSSSPIDRRFAVDYESFRAAGDLVGGRFPGGQTSLFQGLWTDPATGINFARARWFDSRGASWLSQDPLQDVDSPNLYAFVMWSPQAAIDPQGLQALPKPSTPPPPAPSAPVPRWIPRVIQGGLAAEAEASAATAAGAAGAETGGAFCLTPFTGVVCLGVVVVIADTVPVYRDQTITDVMLDYLADENAGGDFDPLINAIQAPNRPRDPATEQPAPVSDLEGNVIGWREPAAEDILDLVAQEGEYEYFYRTMNRSDFEKFRETGMIVASSETFISTSKDYSLNYDGVLVELQVAKGTTQKLLSMGVRQDDENAARLLPNLPIVRRKWNNESAFFKFEGGILNIDLGKGAALDAFNESIRGFEIQGEFGEDRRNHH